MKVGPKLSTSVWLLTGSLAPLFLMANVTVIGIVTPNYSPISQTVSILGISGKPYAWALNGGYILYAVLICIAAFSLARSNVFAAISRRGAFLLAIHAAGMVLLAVFPDSLTSMTEHLIHDAVSTLAYVPLLIGILVFRSASKRSSVLKLAGIVGLAIVAANVPMPVINMLAPVKPFSGLLQRVLAGAAFCWLGATFGILVFRRGQLQQTSDQLQ